jgi:hypothetical protein
MTEEYCYCDSLAVSAVRILVGRFSILAYFSRAEKSHTNEAPICYLDVRIIIYINS